MKGDDEGAWSLWNARAEAIRAALELAVGGEGEKPARYEGYVFRFKVGEKWAAVNIPDNAIAEEPSEVAKAYAPVILDALK